MDRDDHLLASAVEAAEEMDIKVVDSHVPEVSKELLQNVIAWVCGAEENMSLMSPTPELSHDSDEQREIKRLKEELQQAGDREYQYRNSVARRRNVDVSQVYLEHGDVYISPR